MSLHGACTFLTFGAVLSNKSKVISETITVDWRKQSLRLEPILQRAVPCKQMIRHRLRLSRTSRWSAVVGSFGLKRAKDSLPLSGVTPDPCPKKAIQGPQPVRHRQPVEPVGSTAASPECPRVRFRSRPASSFLYQKEPLCPSPPLSQNPQKGQQKYQILKISPPPGVCQNFRLCPSTSTHAATALHFVNRSGLGFPT